MWNGVPVLFPGVSTRQDTASRGSLPCASQGVPWFKEHGQWAAGNYTDVAPGDVIFFDWDGGGSDHVGLVIGTDGTNVYTVEGNSGDACKIKSYPLNSQYIHGYGLMNW